MSLLRLRSVSLFVVPALASLAALVACGSSGNRSFDAEQQENAPTEPTDGTPGSSTPEPGFGKQASGALTLDPKNTTVVIDTATAPATPGSVAFKVLQKTASGDADVTSKATFSLDDATLGTFAGATFTSVGKLPGTALGMSTRVQATSDVGTALGTLTVVQLRKTGAQRDFFFIVPYAEDPSPKSDVLTFSTKIKQVDVAFSMDTTASLDGSINNLKSALQGTLLAQLQAAIPNVGLAVVDFKDYPVFPYGMPFGDYPVKVRQTITTNLAAAQAAVGQLSASGGGDGPEAQISAMQHILTGEALSWSGGSLPAHVAPAPAWGGVDFRPGSVPVVVNITDVDWHGSYSFTTPTMATLKAAFQAKGAFFVDVTSGPEDQANELSDATNSSVPASAFNGACGGQCCTGVNGGARAAQAPGGKCRLNFLHSNGQGVSTGVVNAIQAISVGAAYDVKAIPSNDPSNPGGVDATKFIKALRAMEEGNAAAGCPATPARDSDNDGIKDTFVAVKVGTPVCFEVIPAKNDTVLPLDTPQFFNAFVDVVGVQGNVQLDRRSVLFLVPPKDPGVK